MLDHDRPATYGNPDPSGPIRPTLAELLDTLDKAHAILDEQVDRLTERLAPALEPEGPHEAPGLVQQGGPSSILRDRLASLHMRFDRLHARLDQLTARIDL